MGRTFTVDLFCEDAGHELFAQALLGRLAEETQTQLAIRRRSSTGGRGRALAELDLWQRRLDRRGTLAPDLLLVLLDGNCEGWHEVRNQARRQVRDEIFPRVVIGCPEPHVERWCMADPGAFRAVIGVPAPLDPGKCERDLYKALLGRAIAEAGLPLITTPMEFSPDLVAAMDLYLAGKNQPSLKHVVDDLRTTLQTLKGGSGE